MKSDTADYSIRLAAKRWLLFLALAGGFFGCSSEINQNTLITVTATPESSPTAAPRVVPKKISVMRFPPRYEAELKKSVNVDLKAWQRSLEARDLDRHLAHYAETVETYYLAANADKNLIQADRRRAFERFDTIRVQLINIEIFLETQYAAVVVFDKSWDFKGANGFSNGLVQQEIKMRKVEKDWLIVSERDLEIYRYRNE